MSKLVRINVNEQRFWCAYQLIVLQVSKAKREKDNQIGHSVLQSVVGQIRCFRYSSDFLLAVVRNQLISSQKTPETELTVSVLKKITTTKNKNQTNTKHKRLKERPLVGQKKTVLLCPIKKLSSNHLCLLDLISSQPIGQITEITSNPVVRRATSDKMDRY